MEFTFNFAEDFLELTTPQAADACLRLGISLRLAKSGIRSLTTGQKLVGRALPVQHFGSVDVFIEAMQGAAKGDVLVIDNQGRVDEACVGDLTALEAKANGLAGMIVWGFHRDTAELLEIDFPVFSYGAYPAGPVRLDTRTGSALEIAYFGDFSVSHDDFIMADSDGVLFAPMEKAEEIVKVAKRIRNTERKQAKMISEGRTLSQQLLFEAYLKRRAQNPDYSFREHLRTIGGEIEE
jgi:4-hydroxy-4-methyl-2-oxoglutarate aldolase